MTNSSPQRSSIISALQAAGRTLASQKAGVRLLRSIKFLLIAVLGMALLDVLLHLSPLPRMLQLAALVAAILLLLVLAAVTVIWRRPSLDDTARHLEKREPGLGSKLTNVLQLHAQSQDPEADPLTRNLAQNAVATSAREVEPATLAPLARFPAMKREIKIAMTCLAAFGLLVLLLGKPAHRQLARLFDPYGDHPPVSFSWLDVTKPVEDGVEIVYGESASVEVTVSGHELKDVILEVAPSDKSSAPRSLPMAARDDKTFVASLDDIRQPLTIFARSKNERSRSKRREISVELIPQLVGAELEIIPPDYTGLPPRKQKFRFAGLQALEGSTLDFTLRSNRPLGEGSLTAVTRGEEPVEESVPLAPGPDSPPDAAEATLLVRESGQLSFHFKDVDGRSPHAIPTASLTVSRDLSPAIAITSPAGDSFIVEDHPLKFEVSASDDYGLRQIRTFLFVNGQSREPVEKNFEGVGPRHDLFTQQVSLAEMDIKPGDILSLAAEVLDNCPDPHLSRTKPRKLEVISTEQYNEFLRKQADVASISGKYEDLLNRFEKLVEAQKKLAENGTTPTEQEALNEELEKMAQEMEEFGRDNPVYDFEKDLQQELKEMGRDIRDSVQQNKKDLKAGKKEAAKEHADRLDRNRQGGEDQVRQPLEDLATLHELIKDFNEFQALHEEQKTLRDLTERFHAEPELNAQDRMSLQQLAPQQRDVASALENLQEKLKHHANLAEEKFPKAAQSARDLAEAIEQGSFARLGRQSSQSMVSAEGNQSHERATHLEEEMAKLIGACKGGTGQCQSEGFDQYLKIPGRNPGNSFAQMMQSLKFSPFGGSGGSGSGMSGSMATGGRPGQSPALLGGEAMMPGAIAGLMAGGKGPGTGPGQGGGPIARVDQTEGNDEALTSSRQTETPESQAILSEYQNITDAYFEALTKPK